MNSKNERLTPRQVEILQSMVDGDTTHQIAIKLNISYHTVKRHQHHIYERLNAVCAAHAVAIGFREGIIK